MGLFSFGKKANYVVVLSFEGTGRLRLNGNPVERAQVKRNAAGHAQTVCWMEVTAEGARLDQGTGPAAGRLAPGEAERLLRDVPLSQAYRSVIEGFRSGLDRPSFWYKLPEKAAGRAG